MLGFRPLWVLSLLVLVVVRSGIARASSESHNITLESMAPQIVWSPALCNTSLIDTTCSSAWRVSDDVPGTQVMSTNGPDPAAGDVIPQMFLSFRATAIYIYTSQFSTATVNVTLSSTPLVTTHTDMEVNSSVGLIGVVGLSQDIVFTLAITYVPDSDVQDGDGGRLDIQSIVITVPNVRATSSILPSMILPTTSTLPIFSSSHSQTPTISPAAHKHPKGAIIGESLGSVFGAIILVSAGVALVFWTRRRKRMKTEASERDWGDHERGTSSSNWF